MWILVPALLGSLGFQPAQNQELWSGFTQEERDKIPAEVPNPTDKCEHHFTEVDDIKEYKTHDKTHFSMK